MKTKKQKWFSESTVPGKRDGKMIHSFLIENLVYKGKSRYQDMLIFDNSVYGRVFVLDNIVQLSESDEFIYHEMLVHPALLAHRGPKKILIIGGGDGGTLRECLKHDPEEVILVDIDKQVLEIAQRYLPFTSQGAFKDKRVRVLHEDGKNFMKRYKEYFDIVIIDGGDPIGPSLTLFEYPFYRDIFAALKKDGMAAFQIGSFLDTPLIQGAFSKLQKAFPSVIMLRLTMPSYHCGDYCFMAASKKIDLGAVSLPALKKRFQAFNPGKALKYYDPYMDQASRVIPPAFKVK
ncbi:MAG: polyamine aminopropyltransferase [Candidatus Omnitrophota bacterium]|jgi:spermidine synthase